MILAALGVGLLTGMAAATYVAALDRATPRDADLANFQLVDFDRARVLDREFPAESVLVIYFGYTTCLRACPTALDSIAAAIDSLGAQSASVRPVFIDMDPERAALVSLPLYMQSFGPDFPRPDRLARRRRAGSESLQGPGRTHPVQCRSDRLCDDACLADLRDATR